MDKKGEKNNAQETESEDELPRVSPSKQERLKHILVAVDAAQGGGGTLIFLYKRRLGSYNQAPHLTQNTNGKVTTSQLDITNESQEVSPFPAGDHKASTNRRA